MGELPVSFYAASPCWYEYFIQSGSTVRVPPLVDSHSTGSYMSLKNIFRYTVQYRSTKGYTGDIEPIEGDHSVIYGRKSYQVVQMEVKHV